jgi:hypothetical protein
MTLAKTVVIKCAIDDPVTKEKTRCAAFFMNAIHHGPEKFAAIVGAALGPNIKAQQCQSCLGRITQ